MRTQKIETIRKRFHKEWLLIAVDKMDESTTTPLTGHLVAHSPRRNDIYALDLKRKGNTLSVYSEDGLSKGYAAAFHEKA